MMVIEIVRLCICGCGQSPKLKTSRYCPGHHMQVRNTRGSVHPNWKGNAASNCAGRFRAKRRFSLGQCDMCDKPARDRHHKDDNPLNNSPENVLTLCRRCHMIVDGRLDALIEIARRPREMVEAKPCVNCGERYKPLRKGRCHCCNEYFRRHGFERTRSRK